MKRDWERVALGAVAVFLGAMFAKRRHGIAAGHATDEAADGAELVAWAETAAIENLKARLATGDYLASQANTLLAVLLVGIGGGLGYSVKLAEAQAASPFIIGMACATVWLCAVAAILMTRCIVTRNTEVVHNDPKNLYQPALKLTLAQVQAFELENVQVRIDRARRRNAAVAWWLDACRYAAIATPFAFIAGAAYVVYR